MKLEVYVALGLALPCYAALTKGHIEVKAATWEKSIKLSTKFDSYNGNVLATDSAPPLQVQLDIEKAQTTEVDIEILNGFWTDLYPFLGISSKAGFDSSWGPPYAPIARLTNVQKTPGPETQQKENAFTACYPNPTEGLPHQASAVWKYNPAQGGKLTTTFIATNGTRLPAAFHGLIYQGDLDAVVYGSGLPPTNGNQLLELFFIPTAE